jgi:uncharacterized protein (TIGR02271 family)
LLISPPDRCAVSAARSLASYVVIELPKNKHIDCAVGALNTLAFSYVVLLKVGAAVVSDPNDGERELLLSAKTDQSSADSVDNPKLTLLAEELSVGKETVETGRLRVSKQTRTREAFIDESLLRESAEVETIPIGRQISEMPSVRHEGETIIIPIVEEVLHTERRLVLKEEVRITRRRDTEQFHDRVTLRYQEAVITRVQSATEPVDTASAKEKQPSDSKE